MFDNHEEKSVCLCLRTEESQTWGFLTMVTSTQLDCLEKMRMKNNLMFLNPFCQFECADRHDLQHLRERPAMSPLSAPCLCPTRWCEPLTHRRSGLALSWLLLSCCLQANPCKRVSAVNLRSFIGCAVREFTFLAKKPGCGGMHITTDACWGRCETWEVRRSLSAIGAEFKAGGSSLSVASVST